MEFFIRKNSTLPIIKVQIVKDGRVDFREFDNLTKDSTITFSMWNEETNVYYIMNKPASVMVKPSTIDTEEVEYYVYYQLTSHETRHIGGYVGEFKIKNNQVEIILPRRKKLFINITESFSRTELCCKPSKGNGGGISPVPSPIPPTPTPTNTVTPTVTPSITPTISVTPSITPTISVTPSVTPTISVTPSITPTNTITPSITPTNTVTPTNTPTITPSSVTPTPTPTVSSTPNYSLSCNLNCVSSDFNNDPIGLFTFDSVGENLSEFSYNSATLKSIYDNNYDSFEMAIPSWNGTMEIMTLEKAEYSNSEITLSSQNEVTVEDILDGVYGTIENVKPLLRTYRIKDGNKSIGSLGISETTVYCLYEKNDTTVLLTESSDRLYTAFKAFIDGPDFNCGNTVNPKEREIQQFRESMMSQSLSGSQYYCVDMIYDLPFNSYNRIQQNGGNPQLYIESMNYSLMPFMSQVLMVTSLLKLKVS